ncbi:uncharacterized protein RSE6_08961 [Rhynchosporium secalis]|uniref:Uncharacterized protein n=1 Tax=Rhynchosporium secalis TaxID=38038 RepID=A0A1E1MGS4_RHYSE|nr:uncharacterized protein RSE6_08961 [Rhynchosporium secalis]
MSANRRGIYRAMTNNYACSYPVTIGADNWACQRYLDAQSVLSASGVLAAHFGLVLFIRTYGHC